MRELHVDIKNKIATYSTRGGAIVCGNNDYKIRFSFDSEWDEYESKTVRFIWNDKYIDVVILEDTVPVPMLSQVTELTVGVYAGEKLYTTTPAKIPCLLSVLCESDVAKEADYYEVNGTLEYRLPVIKPEDDAKILQAVNGVYELREAPDLTMNSEVVNEVLGNKVKPVEEIALQNQADIGALNALIIDPLPDGGIASAGETLKTDAKTIIGAINELNDEMIFVPAYQDENGNWFSDKNELGEFVGELVISALTGGKKKICLIDLSLFEYSPNITLDPDTSLFAIVKNTLQDVWDVLPDKFKEQIQTWAEEKFAETKEKLDALKEKIDETMEPIVTEVQDWVDNTAKPAIEDTLTEVQAKADEAETWIHDAGAKVETWVDKAEENITATANKIFQDTQNKVEDMQTALQDLTNTSSEWGKNVYNNLVTLFVGNDVVEDAIQKAMTDTTHDGLTTTDKTIIGAINEVNATVQVDANVNAITTLNKLCGISGITDLTGTVWTLEAGAWTASAGYGTYGVTVSVVADEAMAIEPTTFISATMSVGYSSSGAKANYIGFRSLKNTYYYDNTTSFTLNITGGVDVNNTALINWLYANGRPNTGNTLLTDEKTLVGAINELHEEIAEIVDSGVEVDTSNLQTKTDDSLETDSKEIVGAINELHDEISNIDTSGSSSSTSSEPCLTMPQIRFVGMPCSGYLGWVDWSQVMQEQDITYENLKFTIEIVGGGVLQSGDAIQICRMGCYSSGRKLRRLFEYAVTEDDLGARFITFEVPWNDKKAIKLFTKWATSGVNDKSIYFRIRRPKGDLQSNDSGMTVDAEFSNVVSIRCFSYYYAWDPTDYGLETSTGASSEYFYHIRIT